MGLRTTSRFRSTALVVLQFAVIGWLLITGPVIPARGWPLAVFAAGGALGAWAWLTIGGAHLRIRPEPHPEGRLVTWGPYRWIRHPMYACTLLIASSWVLTRPTVSRWLGLALLGTALVAKLRHEEELLVAVYPEYPSYRSRTKRLVPFLF